MRMPAITLAIAKKGLQDFATYQARHTPMEFVVIEETPAFLATVIFPPRRAMPITVCAVPGFFAMSANYALASQSAV